MPPKGSPGPMGTTTASPRHLGPRSCDAKVPRDAPGRPPLQLLGAAAAAVAGSLLRHAACRSRPPRGERAHAAITRSASATVSGGSPPLASWLTRAASALRTRRGLGPTPPRRAPKSWTRSCGEGPPPCELLVAVAAAAALASRPTDSGACRTAAAAALARRPRASASSKTGLEIGVLAAAGDDGEDDGVGPADAASAPLGMPCAAAPRAAGAAPSAPTGACERA